MKVSNFKRLSRTDNPQIPEWMEPLLKVINDQFESITTALQGSLTFDDNFNAEIKEFSLKDNTAVDVKLSRVKGKPRGVILLDRDVFDYHVAAFEILDEKTVRVKLSFTDTAPLGDVKIRLLVVGG